LFKANIEVLILVLAGKRGPGVHLDNRIKTALCRELFARGHLFALAGRKHRGKALKSRMDDVLKAQKTTIFMRIGRCIMSWHRREVDMPICM